MLSRFKTVTAAASLAALSLSLLAGCGSDPTAPAASSTGSDATTAGTTAPAAEIQPEGATMWALSQAPANVAFEDSIERWNAGHADEAIAVEFFAGEDLKTKLRTSIGAGAGPTFIYSWGGGILESYVEAGEIEDLTPYIAANPVLQERYPESIGANGVIDGKTYALPNSHTQPVLLYYNKALFDEAGVEPPESWEDLMELVTVFKGMGIAPISLAGQSRWPELMYLSYLVDRIGGPDVFDNIVANQPDAWSDPAVQEALDKIKELVDAGAFIDGFATVAADTRADQALLYTGRAAMLLHMASAYGGIKTDSPDFIADGKLGFATFPSIPNGKGDAANLVGTPAMMWTVSSKATDGQKKTAIDYLVNGLFDEAYVQKLVDQGAVPAVVGVESQLEASPDADFQTSVYAMVQEAPHFQLAWDQALSPEQAEALLTNLSLVFLGEQTGAEFIAAMNATIA
jgi:raffinose/stachyose/melibiose transport system substrate-binding protein